MNLLALDTTLGACSAAVAKNDKDAPEIFGVFELRERAHAETIMGQVTRALKDAGLSFDDLDALAVTTGPGSFTGVRVGIAAARGLSLATGLPVIGVSSLDVMARMALDDLKSPPERLAVAVDARRGEVYLGLYDASAKPLSPPQALVPCDAAALLKNQKIPVVAGSGAGLIASDTEQELESVLPDLQPDAATLARMALALEPGNEPVRPLYLRPPDAKPQTGKTIPRQR